MQQAAVPHVSDYAVHRATVKAAHLSREDTYQDIMCNALTRLQRTPDATLSMDLIARDVRRQNLHAIGVVRTNRTTRRARPAVQFVSIDDHSAAADVVERTVEPPDVDRIGACAYALARLRELLVSRGRDNQVALLDLLIESARAGKPCGYTDFPSDWTLLTKAARASTPLRHIAAQALAA